MVFEMDASKEEIEKLYEKLKKEAAESGYFLNPDEGFVRMIIQGLLVNEKRYGSQFCPCRLFKKDKEKDSDIICPCDYRDADLNDYGSCYCGLYVSQEVIKGNKKVEPVPERRNAERAKRKQPAEPVSEIKIPENSGSYPVWRCKVCGYLCARENPPDICPICKATKDRFEKFNLK